MKERLKEIEDKIKDKKGEKMEVIWDYVVWMWEFLMQYLVYINSLFAIVIVFFQRRNPKTVWTWLLLLYFIPVLGFLFYLLLGTDMRKQKMFQLKGLEDRLKEAVRRQEWQLKTRKMEMHVPEISQYSDLVMYNLETMGAVFTDDNDLDIFTDGNEKFEKLLTDIGNAEKFIHLQYYIFKNDVVFARICEALTLKAKEGVEVRILFDAMGCRLMPRKIWKRLQRDGIFVAEFFPALLKKLHLRMNYRNHRKIVVIDNRIAYVGGFNVAKEYVGLEEKFGYWRDTHLRIEGSAVLGLSVRFLLDWNYAAGENLFAKQKYVNGYASGKREFCGIQIISSGPDSLAPTIRDNYVRLIHKAKESIYIQSPYFIPDESLMSALLTAIYSGIKVVVMIPCKPDHHFVYWATYSYIGELVMAGAECYTYDRGFLHAKGLIADEEVFCYGTANMDIRSFSLNFEVNAVVYDTIKARTMADLFREDLKYCSKITRDVYAARTMPVRIKEQLSRLLSPLL